MPTVYIVNKGGHDFGPATKFGKLVFLSEGHYSPFAVDKIYREIAEKLRGSSSDDYILSTGLTIMNSIACSCFTHKHGRLNLLLYKDGKYISRTIIIGELL